MSDDTFIDESFFTGESDQKETKDSSEIAELKNSFSQKQIGSIAKYVEPVNGDNPIENLVEMFKSQEDLEAVPVEEYDHVVGVIDRKTAAAVTNTAWKRLTAKNVIDYTQRVPTLLYGHDFIEKTLQKVSEINREYGVVYFPVFNNRNFYGLVSLDSFLTRIAEIREQDLQKASVIQQSFLPQHDELSPLPFKFQAWYRMANALGGDCYHVYPLSDSTSLICCFDVSGKNVAASLLTIAVGSFFKTLSLIENSQKDPASIICLLDKYLQKTVPAGNFITAVICFADLKEHKIVIYNCGHTTSFMIYKDAPGNKDGKIASIRPGLPPLGMGVVKTTLESASSGTRPYSVLPLRHGMHLDIYSDGFTDMKNDDGMRYEDDRVKRFFISLYDVRDEEVCKTAENTVDSWIENAMLPDDVTIIDVRF